MDSFFMTNQGKVRHHNEDAGGIFKNDEGQILAVVADGMGGHLAGDVASELATSHIHSLWQQMEPLETPEQSQNWLKDAFQSVNREIKEYAEANDGCQGMGTTLVAAVCTDQFLTVGHIGDSRCYFANAYGFKQLTEDHSLVNELVRTGQITEEEAESHPRKNVLLKAMGTELSIDADVKTVGFEPDNRVLLCSDGLTNKVNDEELKELESYAGDWESFCERMVALANERGGEDNITLAVVHYPTPQPEKEGVD
ncbi:Stp1/IreP family PP2C-type Ser/Thr phosphatase [Halobacillus fulvus]|nr:Stp1/IreP family PP2C-type Ser/Thr phosphatase [Halobacillus fulvus]